MERDSACQAAKRSAPFTRCLLPVLFTSGYTGFDVVRRFGSNSHPSREKG
jgi:hypothetical protein